MISVAVEKDLAVMSRASFDFVDRREYAGVLIVPCQADARGAPPRN
jgi:hypothetical protein